MHESRIVSAVCGLCLASLATGTAHALQAAHPPKGATIVRPKPYPQGTLLPSLRHPVTSLSSPDIEELDFAHYFGDEERTLCARISGRIVEIHDPTVFTIESLEIALTGVTSVASIPEGAPGGAAQMHAAHVDGLESVPGAASWLFQPAVLLRGGAWEGARWLQIYVRANAKVLYGVTADRLAVLSLLDSGFGWADGDPLGVDEPIDDLCVLDFDGDGIEEIAILSESGVSVLEADGSVLSFFPSVGTDFGALEPVRIDGAWSIAWATLDTTGARVLQVIGDVLSTPLPLKFPVVQGQAPQVLDLAAMTAGDCNADGQDDLVLTDFASHRAILLWNQGLPTTPFTASTPGNDYLLLQLKSPVTDPGAVNDCAPLIADLDGNDKADLAFGLDTTHEIVLFTSVPPPGTPLVAKLLTNEPLVPATTYYNAAGCLPPDMSPSCTDGVLNLAFNISQQLVDNYDYVEATVWWQPALGAPVEPLSISHTLHPFYGTPPRNPHQWIRIPIPETWIVWPAGQNYFVRYRLCRANVTLVPPRVLAATPSFVNGTTLKHTWPNGSLTLDDPDFDYLEGLSTGVGFLLADSILPDGSAMGLKIAPSHLRALGGIIPSLQGNNYLGALYTKVTIPPPPSGGLEVIPLVLVSGALVPW